MSGHSNFRKAIEDGIHLDYLRGIADRGVTDAQLMSAAGMDKHPTTRAREALEQMVHEDYVRDIQRPFL